MKNEEFGSETLRNDLVFEALGQKYKEQFDAKPEDRMDENLGQGQTSAIEKSEKKL